jgi:hypothetical protein
MKTKAEYYADFYKWLKDYVHPHASALSDQQQVEVKKRIFDYVELAHPLTKEIYADMDDKQRKSYPKPRITGTVCGLHVAQDGGLDREWSNILAWADKIVVANCRIRRQEAGWTDEKGRNDFLVDPNGNKRNPMNMPYGMYTQPSDAYNRGMWTGVLTPDVKFTA